ncbi:hypothetical protein GCM10010433_61780 [Streptomyces pulveraceus]
MRPHFTPRTTSTASLARSTEEQFPELAKISVTTEAWMLSAPGNKRFSLSPTQPGVTYPVKNEPVAVRCLWSGLPVSRCRERLTWHKSGGELAPLTLRQCGRIGGEYL